MLTKAAYLKVISWLNMKVTYQKYLKTSSVNKTLLHHIILNILYAESEEVLIRLDEDTEGVLSVKGVCCLYI